MHDILTISIRGPWLKMALCCLFLAIVTFSLRAQEVNDTLNDGRIHILHADRIDFETVNGQTIQKLKGDVQLYQDSTFMFCDSAIIVGNQLDAIGRIIIQQGDSTHIFSDTLNYDGDSKQAVLLGRVVLRDKEQKLYSDYLQYDLIDKIGVYEGGATLTNDTTHLTSQNGRYDVNRRLAFFLDSVIVLDSQFVLKTDSLQFNVEEQKATFIAPTSIVQDSAQIYCESGFYEFSTRNAQFSTRANYQKNEQRASADTISYFGRRHEIELKGRAVVEDPDTYAEADRIVYHQRSEDIWLYGHAHYKDSLRNVRAERIEYNARTESVRTSGKSEINEGAQWIYADDVDYDQEKGLGIAKGHVIIRDTTARIEVHCERAYFDQKADYMLAMGESRPWMINTMDNDSLYISADTFLSYRNTEEDTNRLLLAFHQVLMYKSDFQGSCDSLVYFEKDSLFTLFDAPVLWSDTTQFSADTIHIRTAQRKIDRVDLIKKGLIVSTSDEILFNQIKGKEIYSYFQDDEPHHSDVIGNAESIYYSTDEIGEYVAANKSVCSEMTIYFKDRQVKEIHFFKQPKASMLPMSEPGIEDLRLESFFWNFDQRPKSKYDVINFERKE